jgi:hypothetical protein
MEEKCLTTRPTKLIGRECAYLGLLTIKVDPLAGGGVADSSKVTIGVSLDWRLSSLATAGMEVSPKP